MFSNVLAFVFLASIACEEVNIGGLFEVGSNLEKAFNFAIETSKTLQTTEDDYIFNGVVANNVNPDVPFEAMQFTCLLLQGGIVALIGPRSFSNIEVAQSICDAKEVPFLVTRWKIPSRSGTEISFYPHPPLLSQAYWDIIRTWNWPSVTVLYEDDESLLRMMDLVENAKNNKILTDLKQLDPMRTGDCRETFKKLKESDQRFIVLDCHIDNLEKVLTQLQQVGLINEKYNYFITNLDAHTIDLTPFMYSGVNFTGIRLIDVESDYVGHIANELFNSEGESWNLRTETALVIDAVHMFWQVLNDRRRKSPIPLVEDGNRLSCDDHISWKHGYSLVNSLRTTSFEGLTGLIKFSPEGYRHDFSLTIYQLKEGGTSDVGNWNASYGLSLSKRKNESSPPDGDSMKNHTYIVQITLTEPYGMLKETTSKLYGNDRFEGFAVDLIAKLAELEGFNYTFVVREDKKNGELDKKTGKWTGMIGDLIDNKTDMAITDFTIMADREKVVDFTDPFMTLGISILFQKPKTAPPSFFSFADPFALDTWMALALSFLVISVSLFIIGRMCAEEWTNPYPCIEDPEYLSNQFSLANAIWFTTGSLMCQGSEIAPIAMSTRMLAGVWWFFCLIMVASYTANLAAFLATENPIEMFKDLESLYENKYNIKYGAKDGGATIKFFETAEEGTIFRKVGDYMKLHPHNVNGNEEGVAKADNEDYAFFMESTSIEYAIQRHCNLKQYGKNLDEKGYAIALRKGTSYRSRLSKAILKLQSSQWISQIKRKWWEERRGGGRCVGQTESAEADPLKLVNVAGCFWVTIYGTVLAAVLVMIEHVFYVQKVSKKSGCTFKEAFLLEMRAYLDFNSNVKPVVSKESLDKSESQSEKGKGEVESKTLSKSKSRSPVLSKSKSKSKDSGGTRSNGEIRRAARPYGFVLNDSKDGIHESM